MKINRLVKRAIWFGLMLLAAGWCLPAAGETSPRRPRFEIGGLAGVQIEQAEDDGNGAAPAGGFYFGCNVSKNWQIRCEYEYAEGFGYPHRHHFVEAAGAWHFGSNEKVRLYLLFGAGTLMVPRDGGPYGRISGETAGSAGLGVKIRLHPKVNLRAEYKFTVTSSLVLLHQIRAGIGFQF